MKVPEYCYTRRADALVVESQKLRIKSAEILEKIRKEQQNRPLRVGKR